MSDRYPSVRLEGGLLSAEVIDEVAAGSLSGQRPADFGFPGSRPFIDEVAPVWAEALAQWKTFRAAVDRLPPDATAARETRDRWVGPLLSLLGYDLYRLPRAVEVDGLSFAFSHRSGPDENAPPVHIVGCRQSLDRRPDSGRPRLGPHSLVQEFLNRTEALWGVATNGLVLRLLRDSHLIRRQSYVEFDLARMMEEERFADFALFVRILHATRLPRTGEDVKDCLLERYHRTTVEQGGRVRDHLRDGVEKALTRIGDGLLANPHPASDALRARVASGDLPPFDYYQQLLKLIYRLLFLAVSEERNLVSDDTRYRDHYSISRLRRLAEVRAAYSDQRDLWEGLGTTFRLFGDEQAGAALNVPILNGDLFAVDGLADLLGSALSNRKLLESVWDLSMYREKERAPWRRINYGALDVEELGSVYESLLDFAPVFATANGRPSFALSAGTERKSTGSYYTPPELVNELVQSALVPVIDDRLAAAKTPKEKEQVLLSLSVCDPACGSGHFLLAAARRIGRELARARTGDEEPSPEAQRLAVRDAITHCIYGVDKNPLAVDLCRVALWLEGHSMGRPLTFLDHRIRCGDSLVGVYDLAVLTDGIPDEAYTAVTGDDKAVAKAVKKQNKLERSGQTTLTMAEPVDLGDLNKARSRLYTIADNTPAEVKEKALAYRTAQAEGTPLCHNRTACDLWTAAFFAPLTSEAERAGAIPTTGTVRSYLAADPATVDGEAVREARGLSRRYRFFHWPLEFPEVFAKGGFDCVLGNPPWEKMKLVEKKWFLGKDNEISVSTSQTHRSELIKRLQITNPVLYDQWNSELKYSAKSTIFLIKSQRFPLSATGDLNTYPLFTELFACQLLRSIGRVGLVVKTGIATDYNTKELFSAFIEKKILVSLYDFINTEGIFPDIAPPERFCLLTLTGRNRQIDNAEFSFFNSNFSMLQDPNRRYRLSKEHILKISPNTKNCPIFKTTRDRDITQKIYSRFPILINENEGSNPWGITYRTMFHMANDSAIFANNTLESLNDREFLIGNDGVFRNNIDVYLPLWEGKFFHHYDHRFGSFEGIPPEKRFIRKAATVRVNSERKRDPSYEITARYWVNESDFNKRAKEIKWEKPWAFTIRDVTNTTTNFRSAIGTISPFHPCGHKSPILTFSVVPIEITACLFSCFFSSFIFDYITKQSLGGASLALYILKQLPMPTPAQIRALRIIHDEESENLQEFLIDRAIRLIWTSHTLDSFGETIAPNEGPYSWDDDERRHLRAEIDAAIARTYGVTREEFEDILDTFTILSNKEIEEWGEFKTKRECLELFDRMKILNQ